jgi:hypothetical protein
MSDSNNTMMGQCGPTCGCGELYEMELSQGVFSDPEKCPHCGIDICPRAYITAQVCRKCEVK